MRLYNYTTTDTDILREIIRHCLPPGVSGFDIAFKNCNGAYRGRAYIGGCRHHDQSKGLRRTKSGGRAPYVVVGCHDSFQKIGLHAGAGQRRNWKRPYKFKEGDGYLGCKAYSHIEALVYLVAHELRHLWQTNVPRGRRVWGARGQYSERDACAFGIQKLREWRRR